MNIRVARTKPTGVFLVFTYVLAALVWVLSAPAVLIVSAFEL
jgi:hypothetical protein